jgi:hypothetical protein
LEKLKIYDVRVEVPPHYDTFADFTYSYHYGDSYVPYVKQDEPLKLECQHFLDCIREGQAPLTGGKLGLQVVRILEASSESIRQQGAPVNLEPVPDSIEISTPAGTNGRANGKMLPGVRSPASLVAIETGASRLGALQTTLTD